MRPTSQIVQMDYQNPDASMKMVVPVLIVCNTSDEDLKRNVTVNCERDLPWLSMRPAHDGIAVMCGGGVSIEDHLWDIRELQAAGGTVFAMNAASVFLRGHSIKVDHQVIADAKEETAALVDPMADAHLIASQVHPKTLDRALRPTVWHLEFGGVEDQFPEERKARGGYALIGGGAAVGNSALCVAYAMGFRTFHIFGFDSSHRGERSHAYDQPMNQFIPCVEVEWTNKTFTSSVSMKAQAEKFQITAQALKQAGCSLTVYGDGLLQTMYTTPAKDLTERDKYRLMWQFDGYRDFSPGEGIVPLFLEVAKPDGLIIDFGCGTGRASLALNEAGHEVFLVDFADNCRDEEALRLPFLEWDLTHPCPLRAPFGLCTDVMEHIPPEDVEAVICNVMSSADQVFFQISTVNDVFGEVIGTRLHQSVHAHAWWRETFEALRLEILWEQSSPIASCFHVKRNDQ